MTAREAPARKPGLTVRLSGANPRPSPSVPGDPPSRNGSIGPEPICVPAAGGAPHTRRFPAWDAREPRTPAHPQPRHHAENDRTMNPPERPNVAPSHRMARPHHATLLPPRAAERTELPVARATPAHRRRRHRSRLPDRPGEPGRAPAPGRADRRAAPPVPRRPGEDAADFLKLLEQQQRLVAEVAIECPRVGARPGSREPPIVRIPSGRGRPDAFACPSPMRTASVAAVDRAC